MSRRRDLGLGLGGQDRQGDGVETPDRQSRSDLTPRLCLSRCRVSTAVVGPVLCPYSWGVGEPWDDRGGVTVVV